jgi:hypothetical protein
MHVSEVGHSIQLRGLFLLSGLIQEKVDRSQLRGQGGGFALFEKR